MPLLPRDEREFQTWLARPGGSAPPTLRAPLGTQLGRGLVSGLTFGLAEPWKEAGEGGIPETLAHLAGLGVGFIPVMRGAGAAVGAAGRLFPSVLAEGVAPAQAVSRMLAGARPFQALTPPGKMAAMGLAGASATAVPDLWAETPRTGWELAGQAGLGALLGAGGEALLARFARGAAPAATVAARPLTQAQIYGSGIARIQGKISELERQLVGTSDPEVQGLLRKKVQEAREIETYLTRLQGEAPTVGPTAPTGPTFGGEGRLQMPETIPPPRLADLSQKMATGSLAGEVVPPARTSWMQERLTAEARRPFEPTAGETAERAVRNIQGAQGPRFTPPPLEAIEAFPTYPGDAMAQATAAARALRLEPPDPISMENLGRLFREGGRLPPGARAVARAAEGSPFDDGHLPPISGGAGGGGGRIPPGALQPLRATGWAQSLPVRLLGRDREGGGINLRILPPSWVYGGTPLEDLPVVFADGEALARTTMDRLRERLSLVAQWDRSTKETIKRLYAQHSQSTEAFEAAVVREAPLALPGIRQLQALMEEMRVTYVVDGVLRPEQRFTNYFPIVRDVQEAMGQRTLQIEKGSGYFPVTLLNRLPRRNVPFAEPRRIDSEVFYPRKVSFDDSLTLYLQQYARHIATRQIEPEVNRLLAQAPGELVTYAQDHVNTWLGVPGFARRASALGQGVRSLQFARTIGASVLSPLVNTFQRLNTFALVRPSAFFGAIEDLRDPAKRTLLQYAHLEDLEKAGGEAMLLGEGATSTLQRWNQKFFGRMFSAAERGNRLHTFFAGLREAQARGIEDLDAQIRFANKLMADTQFIHSPADAIPLFRGDLGRTLGQFQTFRINQARFMLRLAEEAVKGNPLPFIKFFGPSVAFAGSGAMLIGDLADERLTRQALGKAMTVPGLSELLWGVSLSNQLGLGAVNLEDLRSFAALLPGPTVGYVQGLLGVSLGLSAGRGFDLGPVGRQLSFDERVRLATQLVPGGIQLNRVFQALRLAQTRGEYREALDWGESIGLAPPSGDLLSQKTLDTQQILMAAAGLYPAQRLREMERLTTQTQTKRALNTAMEQAGTYLAAGRYGDATRVLDRFNRKYGTQVTSVTPATYQAALRRRVLPPGLRVRPPALLAGTPEFQEPGENIFEGMVVGGTR